MGGGGRDETALVMAGPPALAAVEPTREQRLKECAEKIEQARLEQRRQQQKRGDGLKRQCRRATNSSEAMFNNWRRYHG
jgi:hypothetical protein